MDLEGGIHYLFFFYQKDILRMITRQPNMHKWDSKGNIRVRTRFLSRKEILYSNNVLPSLSHSPSLKSILSYVNAETQDNLC